MAKVIVKDAGVYEGHAYEISTEDGPSATWDCYAEVIGTDGKEYRHLVPFSRSNRYGCERLVARIQAAGEIDTDHWIELEPRPSLEELFGLYAEREDMVRRGYLAEEDMYHGIP